VPQSPSGGEVSPLPLVVKLRIILQMTIGNNGVAITPSASSQDPYEAPTGFLTSRIGKWAYQGGKRPFGRVACSSSASRFRMNTLQSLQNVRPFNPRMHKKPL
jgi:hypothetical protein